MPSVLLGDQPLTTDAWTDGQTDTQISLLYIFGYVDLIHWILAIVTVGTKKLLSAL